MCSLEGPDVSQTRHMLTVPFSTNNETERIGIMVSRGVLVSEL